jgi:hypothetical protein
MSSPIDPFGRSSGVRRTRKSAAELADEHDGHETPTSSGQLVPVSPARTIPPKGPVGSAAQIEAQLIGERRGLRAGPTIHDEAKVSYNRTEWSGRVDRRAPKGRVTKTEI